jgi:hypothetical protein
MAVEFDAQHICLLQKSDGSQKPTVALLNIIIYNQRDMDEQRFYQKPFFFATIVIFVSGALYFYWTWNGEPFQNQLWANKWDFVFCGAGLFIWLAFFAQFILPVRKVGDRQKIFDRLLTYLTGGHGPAIFIENGWPRMSHEETNRKGPGVIWLDTASAAVLRTATKFTRAVGPGVVFTEGSERLAKSDKLPGSLDLHTQNHKIGPNEGDDPFAAKKPDNVSDEEFKFWRSRREETVALTRDGIEVVPNIAVTFKIDAEPAKGDEPGSRFGYNKDSVFKAIAGQGINPDETKRVAWNELPARLAADLWREYLSKFTLDELFTPNRKEPSVKSDDITKTQYAKLPPPPPPVPPEPYGLELSLLHTMQAINRSLDWWISIFEKKKKEPDSAKPSEAGTPSRKDDEEPKDETALQTITRMVNERMKYEYVMQMNEYGEYGSIEEPLRSQEFLILRDRGIKVSSVGISGLRFEPSIESQFLGKFTSNWLDNARRERERIDKERNLTEHESREQAVMQYATAISREIIQNRPSTGVQALRTLIRGSRSFIIKDNDLRRRTSTELEDLSGIIEWIDRFDHGR